MGSPTTAIAAPQNPAGVTGQPVQNNAFYKAFRQLSANAVTTAFKDYTWNVAPVTIGQISTAIVSLTYPNGTLDSTCFMEIALQNYQGDNIIFGTPFIDIGANTINLSLCNPTGVNPATSNAVTVIVRITKTVSS